MRVATNFNVSDHAETESRCEERGERQRKSVGPEQGVVNLHKARSGRLHPGFLMLLRVWLPGDVTASRSHAEGHELLPGLW